MNKDIKTQRIENLILQNQLGAMQNFLQDSWKRYTNGKRASDDELKVYSYFRKEIADILSRLNVEIRGY